MEYSKALNLSYQYYPNLDQIIFEDGVCYTMREAMILSKMKSSVDIRAAHLVKSVFGGEIRHEKDGKTQELQDASWFELEPPVIDLDPSPLPKKKKPTYIDAEVLTLNL
jgi:hypothetical protein